MEATTRQDSVFGQINKFVQYWNSALHCSGQKASFKIECENGEASMNMSVSFRSSRKTSHSPSKIKRNKMRTEIYRKKKQLEIGEQLKEQFDDLEINSDFNRNDEVNQLAENIFSSISDENSSVDNFPNNNYQLCFVDEDDCGSCGLSSITDISILDSDEDEAESDLTRTPEDCSDDQYNVGPTVYCHHEESFLEQNIEDTDEEEIEHDDDDDRFEIDTDNFVDVVMCEHYIALQCYTMAMALLSTNVLKDFGRKIILVIEVKN